MQKAIDEKDDEIEALRKTVCELETKLKEHEEKLRAFNVEYSVLVAASVANIFEMAICWHVMPEFYEKDKLTSSIQDLHDYVHDIKDIEFELYFMDETSKTQSRQRWEEVCRKLGWPIKWEREKPPPDLKVLKMIASLSNGRKCVSVSPVEISEAVEKTRELKGLPSIKIEAIVEFLSKVPATLALCGLDYKDPSYYS